MKTWRTKSTLKLLLMTKWNNGSIWSPRFENSQYHIPKYEQKNIRKIKNNLENKLKNIENHLNNYDKLQKHNKIKSELEEIHKKFVEGGKVCIDTAQKMRFSIKDFFSKCDQIHSFLRIWSHLLKKSFMKSFIFCALYKKAERSTFFFKFREVESSSRVKTKTHYWQPRNYGSN